MAKRIQEEIQVTLRREGSEPAAFRWHGRRHAVREVVAAWKATGPWWDGEGERTFFRVTTAEGVYELFQEEGSGRWWLGRLVD